MSTDISAAPAAYGYAPGGGAARWFLAQLAGSATVHGRSVPVANIRPVLGEGLEIRHVLL